MGYSDQSFLAGNFFLGNHLRQKLMKAGNKQIKHFSWSTMADTIAEVLTKTAKEYLSTTKTAWKTIKISSESCL
jgi:hypothetical protein